MNTLGRISTKDKSGRPRGVWPNRHASWIVFLVLACSAVDLTATEVDRLLVAVNGTAITEGDLYIARKLNPLVFSIDEKDTASREDAISRLIDLELIRQELRHFSMDAENENSLDAKVKEWRDRLTEAGITPGDVERLGIRESELNSYLRLRISILEFVDFRFGPFAVVSDAEIEAYYQETFRPQLRDSGLEIPPLAQVSDRIESILKEDKINEALDQWLLDTRDNARIEYFYKGDPAGKDPAFSREGSLSGATE